MLACLLYVCAFSEALPFNLGAAEQADYEWVMERTTIDTGNYASSR